MTCPRLCKFALTAFTLFSGATSVAAENLSVLIVDLYINYENMGETFVLSDENGQFYVDEVSLNHWEILKPWPQPERLYDQDFYGLHSFSGATSEFDSQRMELHVSMPPTLMPSRLVNMTIDGPQPQVDGWGVFMDYDLNWLGQGRYTGASSFALLRPVFFSPAGNLGANLAYQDDSRENSSGGLQVMELTYTKDDPNRLRTIRAGDVVTQPGALGRPLRMGGVQIGTNFGTRPMFITHPLPDFYGQTAVPSALDIYVNGRLSQRQDVQPGSFILEDVPVINGAGQMQVVATDALGRQQTFTQDFYLATDLLAKGLHDYSITLGALRENFGIENFSYGKVAASANWRIGFREDTTLEGHGEISDRVAMVGGSVQHAIKLGGTVNAGLGVSDSDAGTGMRWQVGFRRVAPKATFNLELSGTTEEFETIDAYSSPPRFQMIAAAGVNLYDAGTASLSVVHQDYFYQTRRTIWSLQHARRIFGNVSMSAQLSYLDTERSDLSAGVRFHMSFGDRRSGHAGFTNSRDGLTTTAAFQRGMPAERGYGYRIGAGTSDNNFVDAGLMAQGNLGMVALDVRSDELYGTSWQLGTRGSVAHMAGMTQFSRQVEQAFAVVNVGDIEGVRVYSENIEVGRTNAKGQVLVPGLRPYLRNKLSINVDDLPLNARIGAPRIDASPYARSGVIVNFDVRVTTNVLLRALLPDGGFVPEGSIARVFHTNDKFPVGIDGKLFLQGIDRSSEITIRWGNSTCDLDVPYPESTAVIEKLGDIVCVPR